MRAGSDLRPGRLLRRPGPAEPVKSFPGVQIDDERLAEILPPDGPLLELYEGTIHGEGPAWQPGRDRLVWSDFPNRRLLHGVPMGGSRWRLTGRGS